MLEGLDQVNWRKIDSSNGLEDLPSRLLGLISSDAEISYDCHLFFVYYLHVARPETPFIVPFLIQILKLDVSNKDRVLGLLLMMVETCGHVNVSKLGDIARRIHIYQAICQGIDTYLACLASPDAKVRLLSAALLGHLVDYSVYIRPRLKAFLKTETNPQVIAEIVYRLGSLKPSPGETTHQRTTLFINKYLEFFETLTQNHPEEIVQVAAASAWAAMKAPDNYNDRLLEIPLEKTFIFETLGNAFAQVEARNFNLEDHFLHHRILLYHIEKFGLRVLAYVLNLDALDPLHCHQIVRQMLEEAFGKLIPITTFSCYHQDMYAWHNYEGGINKQNVASYNYSFRDVYYVHHPEKKLDLKQKYAIENIVECDRFWELPTNLFSFFYGLPDSREELRQLVEQSTT